MLGGCIVDGVCRRGDRDILWSRVLVCIAQPPQELSCRGTDGGAFVDRIPRGKV